MNEHRAHQIPAKVMLAGEYGVVIGGSALTIPFHDFHAHIRDASVIPPGKEMAAAESLRYLKQLFEYIAGIPVKSFHAAPDIPYFETHLNHFWLEMNIPTGYGLGSSGAVSAAVYRLFFRGAGQLHPRQQKEDLALIESFFHGKSSGVDALTCYLASPLYFHADGTIQPHAFNPASLPGGYRFFLLDSGVRFETGPLVNKFLENMKDPEFETVMKGDYLLLNQRFIESLLGQRQADPALIVKLISEFQWKYFRPMIPELMFDPWIEGQVSNEYYLKLNGSGGGYMLGITHRDSMETLAERWEGKLRWIS
jgi:mevalonate kinase